jgi:hypothetical protein
MSVGPCQPHPTGAHRWAGSSSDRSPGICVAVEHPPSIAPRKRRWSYSTSHFANPQRGRHRLGRVRWWGPSSKTRPETIPPRRCQLQQLALPPPARYGRGPVGANAPHARQIEHRSPRAAVPTLHPEHPALAPRHPRPRGSLTSTERRLWIATSRAASGTRSTERTPRSPTRCHGSNPEDRFGHGPRRDLVDQCSAYACPMHAHARLLRAMTSTCRLARTRSSPATSHRAHPACACVCRVDKAPRKAPEKLASPRAPDKRNRCSGACVPARGARLTSGRGGGGTVGHRAARASAVANPLVVGLCICSRLGAALLNVAHGQRESPQTPLRRWRPRPSGS